MLWWIAASKSRKTVLKLERSIGRGSVSLRSLSVAMIARGSVEMAPSRERSRHNRDDNPRSSRGSGGYTTKYSHPTQDRYTRDRYAQDRNTQDHFNRSRSVNEHLAQNRSTPSTRNRKAPASTPTSGAPFTCFACGQPGHKAAECPQNSAAQKSQFKGSATRGRLNHLDAEEA